MKCFIGILLVVLGLVGASFGWLIEEIVAGGQAAGSYGDTVPTNENLCVPLDVGLKPHPDANLTTPQIITKYGYTVETHQVISQGYKLTLFRIPKGKKNASSTLGTVFLQHGLLCSSADWFLNPIDKILPFLLADAGYDVWVGNTRGTSYSRNHTTLDNESFEYWNFSWHDMGMYDIPTIIDYILAKSGQAKLHYVGHSMGTTMFFVAMSLHPEYNNKIRMMYALAPVAYLEHMTSPLALLSPLANQEEMIFKAIGHGEFLPRQALDSIHKVGPVLCGSGALAFGVCGNSFFAIAGFDPCQMNTTEQLSNIVGHTPDSISSRTIVHYLQLKNSKLFAMYDYGVQNMQIYGTPIPPKYNLKLVTVPIHSGNGLNDLLATPKDVTRTISELGNVKSSKTVPFKLWNHLDFLYGIDVNKYVNNDILNTLKLY